MPSKLMICVALTLVLPLSPSRLPAGQRDPAETRCDPSLPVRIEIAPAGKPEAGQQIRFFVTVSSDLDPDLVRSSRLEYEMDRVAMASPDRLDWRELRTGKGRVGRELAVRLPDEARREVRARIVITLSNGRTISQTASCWIDPGEPDPPAGLIGRIVESDGTGIRIYRGLTTREPR